MAKATVVTAATILLTGCSLWYPRLGWNLPVVDGGQAQIDRGNVVDMDGMPGIWLAGHRTTHGAVFASLPRARLGDQVCIYGRCYHVVRILTLPIGSRSYYLGPLVLQTSLSGSTALVVVAA